MKKEGKKNLIGKPEWCVVPMDAMVGVVRVFEAGAKVYGGKNTWLPGIKFSKIFSAICRHLFDWFYLGRDRDETSGQHPLCHVVANCLMLLTFVDSREFDNRKNKIKPVVICAGGGGSAGAGGASSGAGGATGTAIDLHDLKWRY